MNEKIVKNSQYFYREMKELSKISTIQSQRDFQIQNEVNKELDVYYEKYFENLRIKAQEMEEKIRKSDWRPYKVIFSDRGCQLM